MTETQPNKFGAVPPKTAEQMTLAGLANLTTIMAFCAGNQTHLNGAHRIVPK